MTKVFADLLHDDRGFIVSAELVLIATIGVLSLVVGLSEVAVAINEELEDVASAFGSINQTFNYRGLQGCKGHFVGSKFDDNIDNCDEDTSLACGAAPMSEGSGMSHGGSGQEN